MSASIQTVGDSARIRPRRADWTQGLSTRTANALRAAGFVSREQVAACSERRLQRVHNLGHASLADLDRWLGRAHSS